MCYTRGPQYPPPKSVAWFWATAHWEPGHASEGKHMKPSSPPRHCRSAQPEKLETAVLHYQNNTPLLFHSHNSEYSLVCTATNVKIHLTKHLTIRLVSRETKRMPTLSFTDLYLIYQTQLVHSYFILVIYLYSLCITNPDFFLGSIPEGKKYHTQKELPQH